MSDPTAVPPLSLIPTTGQVAVASTSATDDDLGMAQLATWLAEVSAEATLRLAIRDVEPPLAETLP
jgi:hypothetical protein